MALKTQGVRDLVEEVVASLDASERLKAGTRERIERLNYEQIFDAAIAKVRAWERDHLVSASR